MSATHETLKQSSGWATGWAIFAADIAIIWALTAHGRDLVAR